MVDREGWSKIIKGIRAVPRFDDVDDDDTRYMNRASSLSGTQLLNHILEEKIFRYLNIYLRKRFLYLNIYPTLEDSLCTTYKIPYIQ